MFVHFGFKLSVLNLIYLNQIEQGESDKRISLPTVKRIMLQAQLELNLKINFGGNFLSIFSKLDHSNPLMFTAKKRPSLRGVKLAQFLLRIRASLVTLFCKMDRFRGRK